MLDTLRVLALLVLGLCLALPAAAAPNPFALSGADLTHARKALKEAKSGDWKSVRAHTSRAKDPVVAKMFRWMEYYNGAPTSGFEEVRQFVQENPHWPRQERLLRRVEETMSSSTPIADVLDWFTLNTTWKGKAQFKTPLTARGKILLALAQIQVKDSLNIDIPAAYSLLREGWVEVNFTPQEQEEFLALHMDLIREEDIIARIDRLLWDDHSAAAQRLMPLVKTNKDKLALFKARIGLVTSAYGVDGMVAKVPAALKNDQGLKFNRLKWREKRRLKDGIIEIIEALPPNPEHAERWWKYKSRIIREYIQDRQYKKAYALASGHGLKEGVEFAEAEWIAGWLSLRYLKDPKTAYEHFYALYSRVETPISRARGAYWAGRAAEANNNPDIAKSWYFTAAKYPTAFYGQMATRKLNRNDLTLPQEPTPTIADTGRYHANELLRAAYIFHQLDHHNHIKFFMQAAAEHAESDGEKILVASFSAKVDRPDYSIFIARELSKKGLIALKAHYPILPPMRHPHSGRPINAPELALIHAITLQESGFYYKARSSAGAVGLMQLMPSTARGMARAEKIRYYENKLRSKDPSYNVALGSAYLNDMVRNWKGSYILAIASYNAGPANAKKWVKEHGDPREMDDIDEIIDWIEQIPFAETRSYVQRVLENVQLYRYLINEEPVAYARNPEDLRR